MTEQRWRRLEELFAAAVELPPDRQEVFAKGETTDDPDLQRQLLGMLAHAAGAGRRIGSVIEAVAQRIPPDKVWLTGRIGPYRIVREIGRGGMGTVFEAIRDDDQYRKRVALKVATALRDAELMLDRFRHERQILAELEHPNIARFLDGGAQDGIPYFAMEYVDGVPITEYSRNLGLRERIDLFRHVCAAVHHAHQSLVVHRDLKPANILVGQDGAPKLLDFGIAKLMTPFPDGGTTATGVMMWTPDYSSPEQARSRAVTTRTDVYSLGLILYEMLTGERGQNADTSSPLALDRSICEIEPPLPSERAAARGDRLLSRQLSGDLDTIVAKAIRKEPERRYTSVAELSDDLGRYLEGHPVQARPGTLAYRVGKLARRHRTALAAAALVVASLAAGAVSTVHQARRAERRFEQVRKLANAFVFDVHDRIENLPGSTEARKSIVQTALTYLENLREDAAGDAALSRELAAAYEKVGDAQGLPTSPNLGDPKGALASYKHAESILNALVKRGDRPARRQLASVYFRLAGLQRAQGDAKAALANYARAQEIGERLLAETPRSPEILDLNGDIQASLTRILAAQGDWTGAAKAANIAMDIAHRQLALNPNRADSRGNLSVAYAGVAAAHLGLEQLEEAAESYRAAIEIRERLVKDAPDNTAYRRLLMVGYGSLGDVLGYSTGRNLGDTAGATAAFAKVMEIAQWLSQRDAADRRSRFDVSSAELRLGGLLLDAGQVKPALQRLKEAQIINGQLLAEDPKHFRCRENGVVLERKIGEALAASGDEREAIRHLETSRTASAALIGGGNDLFARLQMLWATLSLARLRAGRGEPEAAVLADSLAKELAKPPAYLTPRWNEATVYADLGRIYRRIAKPGAAAEWLGKSSQRWRDLKAPKALETRRQRELAAVEADLTAIGAVKYR